MKDLFSTLQDHPKASFQIKKSRWWNGEAYFPLYTYQLIYPYLHGSIKIHYEFRQSEFSKPSAIDGGALGDRHIILLNCILPLQPSYPNFQVIEQSFWTKFFKKNSSSNYQVLCLQNHWKEWLEHSTLLKEIFIWVQNSPEFSPIIRGKKKTNQYDLDIVYSTQQKNKLILELLTTFCEQFIEKTKQEF